MERGLRCNMYPISFQFFKQWNQMFRLLHERFATRKCHTTVCRIVICFIPHHSLNNFIHIHVHIGIRLKRLTLRVLAPFTAKIATLEKEGGANSWPIIHARTLNLEDSHCRDPLIFYFHFSLSYHYHFCSSAFLPNGA